MDYPPHSSQVAGSPLGPPVAPTASMEKGSPKFAGGDVAVSPATTCNTPEIGSPPGFGGLGDQHTVHDSPYYDDDGVEFCFVTPSSEMVAAELELHQKAVVVEVFGQTSAAVHPAPYQRPVTQPEVVDLIMSSIHPKLPTDSFTIAPFTTGNFILKCSSSDVKDRIMLPGMAVHERFMLVFKPWSRNMGAEPKPLAYKVILELSGIPGHAWSQRVAESLLAPHGWIDAVHEDTKTCRDMSRFRVSVWTCLPYTIPTEKWLVIDEPDSGTMLQVKEPSFFAYYTKESLKYLVRFKRMFTLEASSPTPSASGDADSDELEYPFEEGTSVTGGAISAL